MTTKITPEQIDAVADYWDTLGRGSIEARSMRNQAAYLRDRAELLDVALLIADTVDGTPGDYMEAARAVREHYAALADDVVDAEVVSLERQALDRIADVGLPHRGSPYSFRSPSAGADPDAIADAAVGLFESWRNLNEPELFGGVKPAPSTIPADATGLAGRLARIVGPLRGDPGDLGAWGFVEGAEVRIAADAPDHDGEVRCRADHGFAWFISASSLALIPDEPEPADLVLRGVPLTGLHKPVEPPVGTRLRDRDGREWTSTDGAGWSYNGSYWEPWSGLQDFGPLHQVWTDRNDIPEGTKYKTVDGDLLTRESYPVPVPDDLRAPYVAVLPFGATETGQ